ncbi:MAG: [protein-PII] uridylyltransferase family protein [Candidatus Eutrophobiaceae bacterium]
MNIAPLIARAANPDGLAGRLESLMKFAEARDTIERMSYERTDALLRVLDLSDVLYRFLLRCPSEVSRIGCTPLEADLPAEDCGIETLIHWKYCTLLQIAALDLAGNCPCEHVFAWLSGLANQIVARVHQILLDEMPEAKCRIIKHGIAALAMGKLGSQELNFSSDIDLVFVSAIGSADEQQCCNHYVRQFGRMLDSCKPGEFLYRLDLNLRPWGRSGPLVLDIDSTEGYYENSKEAWERFAWLRARHLFGAKELAEDLLERLRPFVYHRSLGMEDIERFAQIKKDMACQHKRPGEWNIKTGEGGIRDIEFFVQLLHIANAGNDRQLGEGRNILAMTDDLLGKGLIKQSDAQALSQSYEFLRRLEHRVQMVDEQQTHAMPDESAKRLRIACAMGYPEEDANSQLECFSSDLAIHRQVAKSFFDQILSHGV